MPTSHPRAPPSGPGTNANLAHIRDAQPTAIQSGDSLHEMNEIAPSPVKDTPRAEDGEAADEYFDGAAAENKSTTRTLGLRDHSAVWWLTRIQKFSSFAINTYLTAHLTNVAVLPLITRSVEASDKYLLLTRPYYQSFPMEHLLITAPILLHVSSGLGLRWVRRQQSLKWYAGGSKARADRKRVAWPAVSGTSAMGMVLAPAVLAHVYANRLLPLAYEGSSAGVGLGMVAHMFARHPAAMWVAYVALIGLAGFHAVWGSAKWANLLPSQVTLDDPVDRHLQKKRRWYGINAVASFVVLVASLGALGVVGRAGPATGWQARHWDEMYRSIPLLGRFW